MKLTDSSIIAELKASGNLPSPTGVALTILDLTRDPSTGTDDMAQVLRGDPALTGQILKYANSAAAGSRAEIISIKDALVRLGMSTVRQLCLGFSVLSNARSGPCPAFDYERYWTRSLAMAVSCQAISRLVPSVAPDEGFTCGLLAHIGRLALASVYPTDYAEILLRWNHGAVDELAQLERGAVGMTHIEVTSAILRDWRLPETYVTAAEHQETGAWVDEPAGQPKPDRGRQLGRVLYAAGLAADICIEKGPRRHLMVLDFLKVGAAFGIGEEPWITMYDEILEEWARMGRVLDVVTSRVPSMEDLVRRAREHRAPIKDRRTRRSSAPADDAREDDEDDVPVEFPVHGTADVLPLDILVATDSAVDMRILTRKLEGQGHRVTAATNGRQALDLTLQTAPQLILSDWMMPDLDGLELCRTLRSSPQTDHVYFIITTSNDTNEELVHAFDAGINDYITKPINHQILAARLRGATQIIRLREQAMRDREELRLQMSHVNKLNRKLQTLALEDQLTGLPNRRAGFEHLERVWSQTGRAREPMLVMLMDIDFFKKVNDTYGHDAGDIVLRETAQVMKHAVREYDSVSRYGGEEFLVVCPGADIEVARAVGDRIRSAVEGNAIDTEGFQGSVTVSIGVAVRSADHASPKELLHDADEALYAAKDAGRNKVCIYSG